MITNQRFNRFVAIATSDSANIAGPDNRTVTDAVYVGTATATDTLAAVMENGQVVTFTGLLAGTIYPIAITRVNNTGTSASDLVACYWV